MEQYPTETLQLLRPPTCPPKVICGETGEAAGTRSRPTDSSREEMMWEVTSIQRLTSRPLGVTTVSISSLVSTIAFVDTSALISTRFVHFITVSVDKSSFLFSVFSPQPVAHASLPSLSLHSPEACPSLSSPTPVFWFPQVYCPTK